MLVKFSIVTVNSEEDFPHADVKDPSGRGMAAVVLDLWH
jgi:hypothetical protein